MIDFCLLPFSQVRAPQYPASSNAPPGAPALRIACLLMPGARALAHQRRDEQSTSNLIAFSQIQTAFVLVAQQAAGSIWE
jgi:hypothetical protein